MAVTVRGSRNIFKITIVEDNGATAEKLHGSLTRHVTENNETFDITTFGDVVSFLDNYKSIYDMAFMDIELPYIDGMEVAKCLRALDRQVILMFVTNMARYVVKDYEADALDYPVEPVHHGDSELKLRRAVLRRSGDREAVLVVRQSGLLRLELQEIRYIGMGGRALIFHTETDSIQGSGTLLKTEEKLKGKGLLQCNKHYLVNQKHIAAVQGYTLVVTGREELQISRPRKRTLMNGLAETLRNEYAL